jgi:large subunit ribosomal protein L31
MKNIHPQYFDEVKITCSCGNTFVSGSTKAQINVEVCHLCHPYYTGKQKFIDTKGKINTFQKKIQEAEKYQAMKKEKKEKEKNVYQSKTLRDLLSEI